MKKLFIVVCVAVLWGANCVCAFAHEHAREVGGDDILIQASSGWQWVGHQQSERSFVTCYGTLITIEPQDKVRRGASCATSRAALNIGVQRALTLYAAMEGLDEVTLSEAFAVGKYAIGSWTGEGRRKEVAVLLDDGEAWHVLTFGKFDEREARARGVPRDVIAVLAAAK